MAEAIVSDLVGRLLGYLGQSAVGKVASYFGGRDKLSELENTMMMIQARLTDAERLREGEDRHLVRLWLKRLKHVLYRFEDVFEEVSLADKERETMDDNPLTEVVCFPITRLSLLRLNRRVSKDVECIMRELDGITSDMHKLDLRVQSVEGPSSLNLMSGRETHSFVLEEDIVGRDENKSEIIQMLLNSDLTMDNFAVIPIVGIGGLGKTALVQLVYNDNNVQQHFELKYWACISEASTLEEQAGIIFKSIIGHDCGQLTVEHLQSRLREAVNGKRYLLVLDDVWDENRERWLGLRRLLCGGKRGSRVIVTSRSKVVALNMGTVEPYELKGLTEEKSWELFKNLAFRGGQEERNPNLTNIGKEIVKKCANVPLAIRTIAGILYAKDTEEEWRHFKDGDLRMMEQEGDNIMSTLKLSYNHLPPQLKQCFAYCSLFPKDHIFDTQQLIWLWMSQGFIEPVGRDQSPDDVGHAYFMELLNRCFFQDVRRNWYGRIKQCKMHDLMHDLACLVGDECLSMERSLEHANRSIRHVHSIVRDSKWKPPSWLLAAPYMRSFLQETSIFELDAIYFTSSLEKTISSLMFLRALNLGERYYVSLPNSIGKLKHLKYLKVRVSSFSLPTGITKLQNLQTLDIRNCYNLRRLPKDFITLCNLRHLLVRCSLREMDSGVLVSCGELVDMPRRFGQLRSLQTLDTFIVGKNNGLDALGSLNLEGGFQIFFQNHRQNMRTEATVANLRGKRLTYLLLNWSFLHDEESVAEAHEILECLQPPSTLKAFTVQEWKGVIFPSWGIDQIPGLLPNLVSIFIEGCRRCENLPSFSRLPHLKILYLRALDSLEYIDVRTEDSIVVSSLSRSEAYFPSLKELTLINLPKSKGWSILSTWYAGIDAESTSSSVINSASKVLKSLHNLSLTSLLNVESLPWMFSYSTMLQTLNIQDLPNLKSLPQWIGCLSQLRSLYIHDCPKLTALPESFLSLTALRMLWILRCPELKRRCEKPDGEDWPLIQHVPQIQL